MTNDTQKLDFFAWKYIFSENIFENEENNCNFVGYLY